MRKEVEQINDHLYIDRSDIIKIVVNEMSVNESEMIMI